MYVNGENDDRDAGNGGEASLRDDLATALRDIHDRDDDDSGASSAGAGGDDRGEPAKPARADGRNDRGQFAGKPKEGEGDQGAAAVEASAVPGEKGAAPAAEAGEADAAPKSWRQEEVAAWANMPAEARSAVLRREREMAATIGRQDNERLFGKEMADIFRPHAQEISEAGATPQAALQLLLRNHNSLRSNNPEEKLATARRLMFEYGIDPSALAQPDPRMPQDPHVQHLMRQVHTLTQQLTTRGQQAQQYAPLPEPLGNDSVDPDIEAFRTDPAHPHFDQVAGHMAGLIESGAAPDLESAYQMAVSARPTLRSTPMTPAVDPAQRSQEKVAAARRAGSSVQGSAGASGDPKPQSMREELRENLRRVGLS